MKRKIFLAVFMAVFFIAGIAGISAEVHQALKVSREELKAEVLQIVKEGLGSILSDDRYDDTYLMAELKGANIYELMPYFRPVEISVIDKDNNILAQVVQTGFLADRYVLTSPAPFSALASPEIQAAMMAGEIGVDIKILPDLNKEDGWKFESIAEITVGNNVAVLQRGENLIFPAPGEFPFRMGRIEDLNLEGREDALYGIGAFPIGGGSVIHTYQGEVEFVGRDQGIIVISAQVAVSDFGGPVFALRNGELELIGLVQFGEAGKARVIGMQTIFDEIKNAGFEINIKFKE